MLFKQISIGFAVFLVLHLIMYAFTGIALWGVHLDGARIFAIIAVHVISMFSLIISYLD